MSNSTTTYWDVDGSSLNTYAFNIETLGEDRLAPPPLRGDNLIIPAAPGRRWMPKVVDQRTITLGMWVTGAEEDGSIPTDRDTLGQFLENWNKLRSLLFTPNRQVVLTKRFYDDTDTLISASALAQYDGGLSPRMNGRDSGIFTVDLLLADPYFYGAEEIVNLSTGSNSVEVLGDDVTYAIQIHVDGPRTNVKVRNSTMGVEVEYHAALASGDDLDIDVKNFESVTDPVGTDPFNSIGSLRPAGGVYWLALQPGTNTIVVSSDSGIGGVIMTYQPVYF